MMGIFLTTSEDATIKSWIDTTTDAPAIVVQITDPNGTVGIRINNTEEFQRFASKLQNMTWHLERMLNPLSESERIAEEEALNKEFGREMQS